MLLRKILRNIWKKQKQYTNINKDKFKLLKIRILIFSILILLDFFGIPYYNLYSQNKRYLIVMPIKRDQIEGIKINKKGNEYVSNPALLKEIIKSKE